MIVILCLVQRCGAGEFYLVEAARDVLHVLHLYPRVVHVPGVTLVIPQWKLWMRRSALETTLGK